MIDPGVKEHRDNINEEVGDHLSTVRAISFKGEGAVYVERVDCSSNVSDRLGEQLKSKHPHKGTIEDKVEDYGAAASNEVASDLAPG